MEKVLINEVIVKENITNVIDAKELDNLINEVIKSDKRSGIINKVRFKKVFSTLTLF